MKRFAFILSMIVALCALPVFGAEAEEAVEELLKPFGVTEASVEGTVYPYVKDFGGETYEEGEATIYYVNGGDIPYVSLTEYMDMLCEILDKRMDRSGITYEITTPFVNCYLVRRTDNLSRMWVDTKQDMLEFDDFNSFTQLPDVNGSVTIIDRPDPKTLSQAEADKMLEEILAAPEEERAAIGEKYASAMYEPESLFATTAETINRAGNDVSLDMADYLIDLVEQNGECYVPLQTLNDLFLGDLYMSMILTGEKLYCFVYGSPMIDEIASSGTEAQEMSLDFSLFNFNELRFLLDCFYGLKEEHGISSFAKLLTQNTNLSSDLVSGDPASFDDAISRLTLTYFDDGHSGFLNPSWRSSSSGFIDIFSHIGQTTSTRNQLSTLYSTARSEVYPEGVPMYQEIGDTAFVTFDSFISEADFSEYYHMDEPKADEFVILPETSPFNIEAMLGEALGDSAQDSTGSEAVTDETAAEGTDAGESTGDSAQESTGDSADSSSEESFTEEAFTEEPEPIDTIRLLYYAYGQITREGSPVKNVVVDLSLNGGGNSDAAIYTLVWMLGQANVALRDTFTGAETIMRLTADLEFNEDYSSVGKGLVNNGFNVYCLISPNSFSCGNLVPAACRMSERVTLIGRTSGGGSCEVLPCTSASGTVFQISGPKQLSTIRNGSFYNIDQGIEPDVVLNRIETFYDREALVEMIHGLK